MLSLKVTLTNNQMITCLLLKKSAQQYPAIASTHSHCYIVNTVVHTLKVFLWKMKVIIPELRSHSILVQQTRAKHLFIMRDDLPSLELYCRAVGKTSLRNQFKESGMGINLPKHMQPCCHIAKGNLALKSLNVCLDIPTIT